MIRLYCRRKEGNKELCPQCLELLEYARMRLSRCPFGRIKQLADYARYIATSRR